MNVMYNPKKKCHDNVYIHILLPKFYLYINFHKKNISHNVYKCIWICNKLPKTLNRPNYFVKLLFFIKMHGREPMYKEYLSNKKYRNMREL